MSILYPNINMLFLPSFLSSWNILLLLQKICWLFTTNAYCYWCVCQTCNTMLVTQVWITIWVANNWPYYAPVHLLTGFGPLLVFSPLLMELQLYQHRTFDSCNRYVIIHCNRPAVCYICHLCIWHIEKCELLSPIPGYLRFT